MKRPVGLILTDSVGMPRGAEKDGVALDETWPEILRRLRRDTDWVVNGEGGRRLVEMPGILKKTAEYYRPETVVIQAGIVDCCNRAMSQRAVRWIGAFPWPLGWGIRRLVSYFHYPLTRWWRTPYSRLIDYFWALEESERYCRSIGAKLFLVEILPVSGEVREKIFDVEMSVDRYNAIAIEVLPIRRIVDLAGFTGFMTADGHHLNADGHRWLAERVAAKTEWKEWGVILDKLTDAADEVRQLFQSQVLKHAKESHAEIFRKSPAGIGHEKGDEGQTR